VRACVYFYIHALFMCVHVSSLFTICCFCTSDMSSFGKKVGKNV
jgi:hypothetical protein